MIEVLDTIILPSKEPFISPFVSGLKTLYSYKDIACEHNLTFLSCLVQGPSSLLVEMCVPKVPAHRIQQPEMVPGEVIIPDMVPVEVIITEIVPGEGIIV